MTEHLNLPNADRSPFDGELFGWYWLHRYQPNEVLEEHMKEMDWQLKQDKALITRIDLELNFRTNDRPAAPMYTQEFKDWRYYEARLMSDEDLVQERQRAFDHMVRATATYVTSMLVRKYFEPQEPFNVIDIYDPASRTET